MFEDIIRSNAQFSGATHFMRVMTAEELEATEEAFDEAVLKQGIVFVDPEHRLRELTAFRAGMMTGVLYGAAKVREQVARTNQIISN